MSRERSKGEERKGHRRRREAAVAKKRVLKRRILGLVFVGVIAITAGGVAYLDSQRQIQVDLPGGLTPEKGTREYLDYLIEKYEDGSFPPTDEELSGLAHSTASILCSQVNCQPTAQALGDGIQFVRDQSEFEEIVLRLGALVDPVGIADAKSGKAYIDLSPGAESWNVMRQNNIPPIYLAIGVTLHEQVHLNSTNRPFSPDEMLYYHIDFSHTAEGQKIVSLEAEGFQVKTNMELNGTKYTQSFLGIFNEAYTGWVEGTILFNAGLPRVSSDQILTAREASTRLYTSAANRLNLTFDDTWGYYRNSNLVGFLNFVGNRAGFKDEEAELFGFDLALNIQEPNPEKVLQLLNSAKIP